jgi:hypothetical protein
MALKSFFISQYVLNRSRNVVFLSSKMNTLAKLSFFVFVSVTKEQKDRNKCVCSNSVICSDGSKPLTVKHNY